MPQFSIGGDLVEKTRVKTCTAGLESVMAKSRGIKFDVCSPSSFALCVMRFLDFFI